ncbi:tachykinins [Aricia agestis]|uniref:tachykinins n=1 Tax=Aricia agestis TaxID=91739 RepID=UPI001C208248|nr:tachykinins [Aricia agestis]
MGAKTCMLLLSIHLVLVSAQEVKRVPQGFVGMRGKKYFDNENEFYKRKPQFFVGVKGKKFDEADFDEFDKRVPMGFVGMRGKKFYPEMYEYGYPRRGSLVGQIEYATDEAEYPFDDINEFLQKLQSNYATEASLEDNEVEKRAKMHQFFGVRGKKSITEKRPYDLTFRGKFIGVRGKKDLKNSGQEVKFLLNGPWPKRRQMGFVGMRGKKWDDASDEEVPN